ncbi:MAG: lysozyme, partial [Gammaproteobacteria bacterium]|nr:lysozyme [Gammaproteobacteria bacterium]
MSLSPTDIIKNAAKHAENEGRTGYDAVSDTWYSHPSPEGGLATIGFGHKGASSDEVASWGIGGMTDEQVSASFDSDWDEATQIAANQYNAAYEDSFSDLPEIGQALLSEIAFNVGRVTNKKGKFGWPSLVRAIKEDDVAGMKKEINRTYTDSDGVAHPMDRRVGFLRDAIDEASDEGAPAPSGEDVGSIEALPDSYSHKIGDFFAGLMGGDQPTRNRRT